MKLKLLQKEVASKLGVSESTIWNWENNWSHPSISHIPKIIEFLSYDPDPNKPKTLGEKLLKYRRDRGMTQTELAQLIGIDPTTLSRLERQRHRGLGFSPVLKKVSALLNVRTLGARKK